MQLLSIIWNGHELTYRIVALLLDEERRKQGGLWGLGYPKEDCAWDTVTDRLEAHLLSAIRAKKSSLMKRR